MGVAPHAACAHTALLQVLMGCGRQHEAKEQHDLSRRALADVGETAANELALAWRALARKPGTAAEAGGSPSVTPSGEPTAVAPTSARVRRAWTR